MKLKFLIYFLLFTTGLNAQTEFTANVAGKCNINQTGSGSGYWEVLVTNYNNPRGFETTDMQVGDIVSFTDGPSTYFLPITLIPSAFHPNATIRVNNTGITGIGSVPTIDATIIRGSPNHKLIPFVSNTSDNNNQLWQEYNMYIIDSLLNNSGSAIDSTTTSNDSQFVWSGGTRYFTGVVSNTTSYNFTDTGHGYVSGDIGKMGYVNASGFHLAQSDYGVADSVAQYFIVSIPDVNTIKIATNGRVTKTHAFPVGSFLYLSATPGEYTDTQPTLTNVQYVGRVPAANVIDVLIADLANAQVPQSTENIVQINTQTDTIYTLVLGDIGKLITMTNAASNTLTVPPNANVAFEIGTKINIAQFGSGQTTISPGSGVTINSADSANKTRVVYSTCSLIKTATNTWLLAGDITI